jgi:hypothetical protein
MSMNWGLVMSRLFEQTEDIDREARQDAAATDKLAFRALSRTDAALRASHRLDEVSRETLRKLLDAMLATHRTTRMLFKAKEDNGRHRPAGFSLVREQVEVTFALTLITSNPKKWARQYHRSAFAEGWIELLAERHECGRLAAFDEFINATGPQTFERIRQASDVSESERDELTSYFESWLHGAVESPLPAKWRFPTPGAIVRDPGLSDRSRNMLQAWYRQYIMYCRYAHVRSEKLLLFWFETHKHSLTESDRENFLQNKHGHALCTSWLAIGSVCTELFVLLDQPTDLLDALSEFWAWFGEMSFFGRELWAVAAREVLVVVEGS